MLKLGNIIKKGQVIRKLGNNGKPVSPHLYLYLSNCPTGTQCHDKAYILEEYQTTNWLPAHPLDLPGGSFSGAADMTPTFQDCLAANLIKGSQLWYYSRWWGQPAVQQGIYYCSCQALSPRSGWFWFCAPTRFNTGTAAWMFCADLCSIGRWESSSHLTGSSELA